ncbi:MAG: hypothetical protein ABW189_01805 [Rickettsiales bacterium]
MEKKTFDEDSGLEESQFTLVPSTTVSHGDAAPEKNKMGAGHKLFWGMIRFIYCPIFPFVPDIEALEFNLSESATKFFRSLISLFLAAVSIAFEIALNIGRKFTVQHFSGPEGYWLRCVAIVVLAIHWVGFRFLYAASEFRTGSFWKRDFASLKALRVFIWLACLHLLFCMDFLPSIILSGGKFLKSSGGNLAYFAVMALAIGFFIAINVTLNCMRPRCSTWDLEYKMKNPENPNSLAQFFVDAGLVPPYLKDPLIKGITNLVELEREALEAEMQKQIRIAYSYPLHSQQAQYYGSNVVAYQVPEAIPTDPTKMAYDRSQVQDLEDNNVVTYQAPRSNALNRDGYGQHLAPNDNAPAISQLILPPSVDIPKSNPVDARHSDSSTAASSARSKSDEPHSPAVDGPSRKHEASVFPGSSFNGRALAHSPAPPSTN